MFSRFLFCFVDRVNSQMGSLIPYLCPVLCTAGNAFAMEEIDCQEVDDALREQAARVITAFEKRFCVSRCLAQICIDFEWSTGQGYSQIGTESNFYRCFKIFDFKE